VCVSGWFDDSLLGVDICKLLVGWYGEGRKCQRDVFCDRSEREEGQSRKTCVTG
jgi:hypothetical protein